MDEEVKNLLLVAMEESAEIAQACSKAIRFGINSHHPNKSAVDTHADEILTEYLQLQSIIQELQKKHILPKYTSEHAGHIKREKINKIKKFYNLNKNNEKE
jgi:hypothetical protein